MRRKPFLVTSGYIERLTIMKKRSSLLSYRLKISLTIALFAIIPFAILSAIHFNVEKTKWENASIKQYAQILDMTKNQIDKGVLELESKILYVKNDTTIRNYINNIQTLTQAEKMDFIKELRDVVGAASVESHNLTVRWYSHYSTQIYGEYCYPMEVLRNLHQNNNAALETIMELKSNEMCCFIDNQTDDLNQYSMYVYTKIINDRGQDHILGMSIPIEEMLYTDPIELPEDYFLGIYLPQQDRSQIVVLHGDRMLATNLLNEYIQNGSCNDYYPIEADSSELSAGRIICLLKQDYVFSQVVGSMMVITGIFLLMLILIVVCSNITSRMLTRKVVKFVERVNLELRNCTEDDNEPADNDFSNIERQVRELACSSREYGKQLEAYELEKKKMELEILQMRFSPHFLYNTLGSIRYQVKNQRIRKSIDSLIAYYRIVLSKGSLFIKIESELHMIREYLNLQTFAYDLKDIEFVYEIDDAVKSYSIIKHLLQPIVENALEHGIRSKNSSAVLTIRARLQDENVVFEIEDTGIGMTQEQISRLLTQPCDSLQGGGYGVYNVVQRIKTYYGPEYGVSYISKSGVGTCATITIPQIKDPQF